ncbi:MAG: diacylglycerol kinase [Candidatus Kerfeldbacteria bacterium]|nr:diacylglycerol kinase [Candidatus Kerfeldbacteria bacterium]
MFNLRHFRNSFQYAWQGLKYVWINEQNFRVQIGIAVLVIISMGLFQVAIWQAIVLIMLILFVLVLEVVNTIFEKMIDILKPRIHSYVEVIKDMMAAAVLLASAGAVIIALLIFVPYLVDLFYGLLYT